VVAAAGGPTIPPPLLGQLKDGGRLVAPVLREGRQTLVRITRRAGRLEEEPLGPAQFVPLIGRHGAQEAPHGQSPDRLAP